MERAREAGGTLIYRDEDLDPQRCKSEYADSAIKDLQWFGCRWDEGPDCGGPHQPYRQSQRQERFLEAWKRLKDAGVIYPCSCLLYTSPSPRDGATSRMPSSA